MYTSDIHGYLNQRLRCLLPIVKLISHEFVVSGTLTAETPMGMERFDLTSRWLQIEKENVEQILFLMEDVRDVWIQEKPNMSYSAIMGTLPESHAAYFGLHLSERKIVVADEVVKDLYFPSPRIRGPKVRFDPLSIEDALQEILTTGGLPPRSWHVNHAFGRRFS